ncbi:DUF3349 domain-containing protein [Rhodococcus gannanensis]|uniref:DUF3349 domain-containing protein n=1 Tax=Rhodococcus gannanensis TaxID=1960308 RepID=A0ABW4PA09_9NOCA
MNTEHPSGDDKPHFPVALVRWLRDGYPDGIPPKDHIPLVAVLARRLTSDQIKAVAVALAEEALTEETGRGEDPSIERDEIGEAITQVAHTEPSAEDIARVEAVLTSAGWSLTDEVDPDEQDPL